MCFAECAAGRHATSAENAVHRAKDAACAHGILAASASKATALLANSQSTRESQASVCDGDKELIPDQVVNLTTLRKIDEALVQSGRR